MGLFDNIIQRVANEIAKAAPAPTVTPVTQAQLDQASQRNQGYGNTVGLTRNPLWAGVPFTPGQPIIPGAINPVRDDGRPDPRRYEYQVAQNINITPTRLVPFSTLRAAADQIDIIRRCVEVLKAKMVGLEWDIVIGEDAAEKIMAETGERSLQKAMALAKAEFAKDISKAKLFWEAPDVSNGLIFPDWLNMALEDVLVLDAWAVWPQKTVGGDLKGLQILDGSTIKPLIDDRGMRPLAPYPAFQQILFGFPRSEFNAPDEEIDADGEFSSDELSYMIRNRRTNTVYGYSPVERSLPIADIYLRAQQFLRAEYTDGVIPELMLKSDGAFTPDQLRAYENVLNDYLSGQTEQRKRANILPAGLDPVAMEGYAEKFKADMHDFLITQICGHFGVQPSEIGMSPKGGLGGSGHQQGQASSSEVIGLIPLSQWMGKMLTQLSYVFLGMPRELEFKFMPSNRQDDSQAATIADLLVKDGTMSRNEARAKMGLPMLEAPEADQMIIETAAGTFILTDTGLEPLAPAAPEPETPEIGSVSETEAKPVEPEAETPPAKEKPAEAPKEEAPATKSLLKYSDDQERDEQGRFSSGGGSGGGSNDGLGQGSPGSPATLEQQRFERAQRTAMDRNVSASQNNLDKIRAEATRQNNPEALKLTEQAQTHLDSARAAVSPGTRDYATVVSSTASAASVASSAEHLLTNGERFVDRPGDTVYHGVQSSMMADNANRVSEINTFLTTSYPSNKSVISEETSYMEARDEIRKFKRWLKKSPNKAFNFEHVPANYAETLNKFVAVEDYEGARWFADRWM
jgi:hypothetical protein